jgi:hypothetical protein
MFPNSDELNIMVSAITSKMSIASSAARLRSIAWRIVLGAAMPIATISLYYDTPHHEVYVEAAYLCLLFVGYAMLLHPSCDLIFQSALIGCKVASHIAERVRSLLDATLELANRFTAGSARHNLGGYDRPCTGSSYQFPVARSGAGLTDRHTTRGHHYRLSADLAMYFNLRAGANKRFLSTHATGLDHTIQVSLSLALFRASDTSTDFASGRFKLGPADGADTSLHFSPPIECIGTLFRAEPSTSFAGIDDMNRLSALCTLNRGAASGGQTSIRAVVKISLFCRRDLAFLAAVFARSDDHLSLSNHLFYYTTNKHLVVMSAGMAGK